MCADAQKVDRAKLAQTEVNTDYFNIPNIRYLHNHRQDRDLKYFVYTSMMTYLMGKEQN